MATPVGDAEPIVPGAPLPVIPERPVTTVSNPALRAKTPAKTMGPSPSAPSLATQRPHTSTSKLKQFDGAATEEPPSSGVRECCTGLCLVS